MEITNERAEWFKNILKVLEDLEKGNVGNTERISFEDFSKADKNEQLDMLKEFFNKLLIMLLGGLINHNLLCPFHEERRPSMRYYSNTCRFHCFAGCTERNSGNNTSWDLFDLIGEVYGLEKFVDQKNKAIQLFVEGGDEFVNKKLQLRDKKAHFKNKMEAYRPVKEDSEAFSYVKSRGIPDTVIDFFNIQVCYLGNKKFVCIHIKDKYWVRRNIEKDAQDDFKYSIPTGSHAAIFNEGIIEEACVMDRPLIITESVWEAMTLYTLGQRTIALNSVTNLRICAECLEAKRIEINQKYDKDLSQLRIIIVLDNDEKGANATGKLMNMLKKRGFNKVFGYQYSKASSQQEFDIMKKAFNQGDKIAQLAVGQWFLGAYKDLNDCWQKNKSLTLCGIKGILEEANKFFGYQSLPQKSNPPSAIDTKELSGYVNPLLEIGKLVKEKAE